ncbi:phycobilisome linker polypeptide [filamentous cyanobacterium CCP5]|nr:phycobilisome linker polypeptide [filamentous cyanobacterium CCP5]
MLHTQAITVSRKSSLEERKAALYQIYSQILERQPYGFERKILAKAEKDFLNDKIGVKRMLKLLGHSEVYLREFYENSSNLKFLELCFKHFMGRAPRDRQEMQIYSDILMRKGVQAVITAMIDSEEYRKHFGCFTVPHPTQEDCYSSPRAFLESNILNQELHGRRGWIVPTMVWHELNMRCEGGTCAVAQSNSQAASAPRAPGKSPDDLLKALRNMAPDDLEQIASALTARQRETLGNLLVQSSR